MISNGNRAKLDTDLISAINLESIIFKGIYDFFEEQDFLFMLQNSISSVKSKLTLQTDEEFVINLINSKYKKPINMVTAKQIILSSLNLNQIYTTTTGLESDKNHTYIHVESKRLDFEKTLSLIEKLLRRLIIDLRTKMANPTDQMIWKDNFPIISRHDIELEFSDSWEEEATTEFNSPFFVYCVKPKFYDLVDPERSGEHYLNFQFYMPKVSSPIVQGGQREYRYVEIMNQMKKLGINRYTYSNYLLYIADNTLHSSSGFRIDLDLLINAFTRAIL